MAYLTPHFEPDIFVSYSHGDPRGSGGSPLKDWTQALIRRLEGQILSLDTEFDDLSIWIDRDIDPTAHLTPELRDKVGKSGVLLIVMSKRYLGSSWCRDELDWFRTQIQGRNNVLGRVFVVRAQETDAAQWPDFLRDERGHPMLGFSFYDPANGFPWGWPDLQENSREFVRELCRLQTALTKRLRDLNAREAQRARSEAAATAKSATDHMAAVRRIYLHAPDDVGSGRAQIEGDLKDDGIVPLTASAPVGNGPAGWQRQSVARMETAKRCEALTLLRTDDDDRFVGDLLDIGVDERERIASARGAPLPCAVFDRTGGNLPINVADFGIARFDVGQPSWRGAFRAWLDAERAQAAGSVP